MNAMNINQATEIVTKAALQNANGASNAVEIIQATAFVRAYVRDQDEYVARNHQCQFAENSTVCTICGS